MRRCSTLVALLPLLLASPASAWVRSMTTGGDELYWLETDLTWHLDDAGCADLPDDDSEFEAVRASWATWDAVECDYGHFRMSFSEGPMLHDAVAEYVPEGANRHVLVWVNRAADWHHSRAVIGVTSATYDATDGRVLDADIEFNDIRFRFTTTVNLVRCDTDVQNTVTHEIGHVLGLDHTNVAGATMEERAQPCEFEKRTLEEDDIRGLCDIVPPEGATDSLQGGLTGGMADDETGCECGLAPGRGRAWPWGLLLLGLGLLGRRR